MAGIVRPLLFAVTRRDWHGAENLPREGGFIVAANHLTNADPFTFAHFLYDNGVAPRILGKASLFTVPVVGYILRASGQVPVYRNTAQAGESLRSAFAALREGECVAIYPEGTLTRDPDLWPMTAKTGVARLALTTRLPVIPVAQWGAHRLLGRYSKVPHLFPRKRITVVAGPPVDLADLYDRPMDAATLREATDRVMADVTRMLEEIRGEKAPVEPFVMRREKGDA
jgi:1-acyl-sn-glycerol-3-phosphate acyltransferase